MRSDIEMSLGVLGEHAVPLRHGGNKSAVGLLDLLGADGRGQ